MQINVQWTQCTALTMYDTYDEGIHVNVNCNRSLNHEIQVTSYFLDVQGTCICIFTQHDNDTINTIKRNWTLESLHGVTNTQAETLDVYIPILVFPIGS